MLLRVYSFSFAAVAGCTFNWRMLDPLQKERWLIWWTTPFSDCDRSKKGKHETYSLKITVGKYSARCLKRIWKWQCKFADHKINWCARWYYSSTYIHYWAFNNSYRKRAAYVFFIILFFVFVFFIFYRRYYFLSLTILTHIEDLQEQRYAKKFVLKHFVSFLLDNGLFSLLLHTADIYEIFCFSNCNTFD